MKPKIPTFDELMNPALGAINALGGSAGLDEMYDQTLEIMNLPEEVTAVLHEPGKSNATEVRYRLAWALTYLKKYGVVENSSRGIWSFSSGKEPVLEVDPKEVVRTVREIDRKAKSKKSSVVTPDNDLENEPDEPWRAQLFEILTKSLTPAAFERLVQRLLRESGFTQVEVTGRSGDGGIDGKGIARIHGLMSFHVVFQCKRYVGVVGPSQIRDFRGAMVGRADKGVFITTGSFSRDALREANRDGATPIDLLNGDELIDKLKELRLGVRTEMREEAFVQPEWFDSLNAV